MPKASWNGEVIAESDATVIVDGNHYFPRESLRSELFESSTHHTTCPWKGQADYMHIVVGGERNENAAWTYPETKPEANNIKGFVAFWKGVEVSE